jgi:hypothetical protein
MLPNLKIRSSPLAGFLDSVAGKSSCGISFSRLLLLDPELKGCHLRYIDETFTFSWQSTFFGDFAFRIQGGFITAVMRPGIPALFLASWRQEQLAQDSCKAKILLPCGSRFCQLTFPIPSYRLELR